MYLSFHGGRVPQSRKLLHAKKFIDKTYTSHTYRPAILKMLNISENIYILYNMSNSYKILTPYIV